MNSNPPQAISDSNETSETKTPSRGVFWLVDGELLAFPFTEDATVGIAKSGQTFNHKLLWDQVRPENCNKPFDWYPRGRVEFSGKGKPVVYMNPNIDETYLAAITEAFGLSETPVVHYDGSTHYRCHLDRDGNNKKGPR